MRRGAAGLGEATGDVEGWRAAAFGLRAASSFGGGDSAPASAASVEVGNGVRERGRGGVFKEGRGVAWGRGQGGGGVVTWRDTGGGGSPSPGRGRLGVGCWAVRLGFGPVGARAIFFNNFAESKKIIEK